MNNTKKIQFYGFIFSILIALIFYTVLGFPLHFFNHFFAGITAGLIALIIFAQLKIRTMKYEYFVPFLFWIYAIIPEFIVVNQQHPKWTNIFLFHEWLDGLLEKSQLTIVASGLIAFFLFAYYLKLRKRNYE